MLLVNISYISTIIVDEHTLPADVLRPDFNDDSDDSEIVFADKLCGHGTSITGLERPPDKLASNYYTCMLVIIDS